MNIKKIAAAVTLGLMSLAASASTLSETTGDVEIKLGGLTTETRLTAGTNESTWGVGYLESIASFSNLSKWTSGTTDGYLYYMLYGISDLSLIPNGTGVDIYNVGATGGVADGKIHLDLYWSATQIPSIDQLKTANPAGRTGYDSYNLLSSLGPAYLKLTFGGDIQQVDRVETVGIDETTATLVQHADGALLPTSGNGAFFLDVVGGTDAYHWDTNGQDFGHDMSGNFTLRPNYGPGRNPNCTLAQVTAGVCFAGLINDPIITSKVPEPASLALFGLGLAGLAGLRRRRNRK